MRAQEELDQQQPLLDNNYESTSRTGTARSTNNMAKEQTDER